MKNINLEILNSLFSKARILPNLLKSERKRTYLENKIFKIRELRNRVAHHEPIWNMQYSINELHQLCYDIISAMSEEALQMLKTIDRFPEVYQGIFSNEI